MVATLLTANKALHSAKKHSNVSIKMQPIAPQDLRFIAFSDASFASKTRPESYAGMIVHATHKDITNNQSCPISPLSWGAKEIQRIVTSTVSAETSTLSTTSDQLTWMRLYCAWILDPNTPWQRPENVANLPKAITVPTYRAHATDLAITDCKSLFDLRHGQQSPTVKNIARSCLPVPSKMFLRKAFAFIGSDALTKVVESNFLRETLRQSRYGLHDAEEVLKSRASARTRLKWLKTAAGDMCNRDQKNS